MRYSSFWWPEVQLSSRERIQGDSELISGQMAIWEDEGIGKREEGAAGYVSGDVGHGHGGDEPVYTSPNTSQHFETTALITTAYILLVTRT